LRRLFFAFKATKGSTLSICEYWCNAEGG